MYALTRDDSPMASSNHTKGRNMNAKYYWLPFPGMHQCVLSDNEGKEIAAGMGASKKAAREAAERNAAA